MNVIGWLMIKKLLVIGYLLMLLGMLLQSWVPPLLYVLAMLCLDYMQEHRSLRRNK